MKYIPERIANLNETALPSKWKDALMGGMCSLFIRTVALGAGICTQISSLSLLGALGEKHYLCTSFKAKVLPKFQ